MQYVCDTNLSLTHNYPFLQYVIVSLMHQPELENYNFNFSDNIVTLTHDPKIDDLALKIALNSTAGYIGSLGSRKTHASRIERLKSEGYNLEQISKIHAPIGLNISSKTPQEIALSIMAEITQVRRSF